MQQKLLKLLWGGLVSRVFGSSGFCPSCQIFTVLMLGAKLNCKAQMQSSSS